MQNLWIVFFNCGMLIGCAVCSPPEQRRVVAGTAVSLQCPRENYKEYHEALGALIPAGNYSASKWVLQDCFQSSTTASRNEAFRSEDYKGALRGRARLFLNGTLNIYKVDEKDAGVYRCYIWKHQFGKDKTSKTWGHLELVVMLNGTEARNPEGECLHETYSHIPDCPYLHVNHNVYTKDHHEILIAVLVALGIVTALQTCAIMWLVFRRRTNCNTTSNPAYSKLPPFPPSTKPRTHDQHNTEGDAIYEEINKQYSEGIVLTKAQLLELLGLPKDHI